MSTYRYADHPVADRDQLVKISIPLEPLGPVHREHVYALPLGGDTYRIQNVPFFDADLGLHDEVIAIAFDGDPEYCEPEVVATVTRRTHVRFSFELPSRDLVAEMDTLECRRDVAIECCGDGQFVANLPDRTVASQFQSFLEKYATWFDRSDSPGAAIPAGGSP